MSDLRTVSEFITFSRNAIAKEFTPQKMVLELYNDNFEEFKDAALSFFSDDVIARGDNVAYILDDLRSCVEGYLDEMGEEILTQNFFNDNYDLMEWPDVSSPLQNVRLTLISVGGSDVVEFLREKIENETGRDPYNESWEIA